MFIPDPTFFHLGSRIRTVSIPDPQTPKKAKKKFLSSKQYDPVCSSRILDPDADFLPSRIPDPQHCLWLMDPDPDRGGQKTCGSRGSGSTTLTKRRKIRHKILTKKKWTSRNVQAIGEVFILQKWSSISSKLDFSLLFLEMMAFLDSDPYPNADPDTAGPNECGSMKIWIRYTEPRPRNQPDDNDNEDKEKNSTWIE
jgi:hypothetical protein